MANPISYNQLLSKFDDLAQRHIQIKAFGNGMIENVNTFQVGNSNFPIMWLVPQSSRMTNNSLIYKVRILLFDIDDTDDSNRTELHSDTLRILNDVINKLKLGEDNDYMIINDATAIPFVQKFTNYCVGWYVDLDIETAIDNNPCNFIEE